MLTMEPTINIFTCCDRPYEDFIPLFVLSNLTYVPDSIVEIGVLDKSRVLENEAVKYVLSLFPNRVFIRQVDFTRADKARFTTNIENKAKYIYISDIDIITLDGKIVEGHLKEMAKTKLPFSNMVRPETRRMTGLHFTSYNAYYPIGRTDYNPAFSDEELLYLIVKNRKIGMPTGDFRPVFGIHMSPNRHAKAPTGWGINLEKSKEWINFRKKVDGIFPKLSFRIKNYVDLIDYISNDLLQHTMVK